jgi:hypothetical protein
MPSPYAGNPSNYPASINIIGGGDVPSSTTFNTAYEGIIDRTAWLAANARRSGMGWGRKFVQSEIVAAGCVFLAAGWHQGVNAWLLGLSAVGGGVDDGEVWLSYGLDGGAGWTQVAEGLPAAGDAAAILAMAVGCEPGSGGTLVYAVVQTQASATITVGQVSAGQAVGGTGTPPWSIVRTITSSAAESIEFVSFNGTAGPAAIYATGGAAVGAVAISTTVTAGGTWHDFAPYGTLGGATAKWLLKTNGAMAVACPAFWQPASPLIYLSADGITWTGHALPFVTGFATVAGLTWNAVAQIWIAAVQASASTVAFYSSPDAITWTLVAAPSWDAMPPPGPSNNQIADLESLGGSLVVTLGNPTSGGPSGTVFSPDLGVTWYPSQAVFPNSDGAAIIGIRSRLAASPTGLLAINNYYGRFSDLVGLPITTI